MKISLFASTCLVALAACSTGTPDAPAPSTVATQPPPATTASPRKLISGTQLATPTDNLVVDPGFGLVGDDASFGSFIAFLQADYTQVTLTTLFDSRSPTGFGGSIGVVMSDGATNKSSDPITVLTSFPGGDGPFTAQIWVSKSTVGGDPADLTFDSKGLTATLTDGTPDGDAYDLTPIDGSTITVGARTWTLLKTQVQKTLTYGGFLVINTGDGGGQFLLAAPQVIAQPLEAAMPSTRSLVLGARARAKSAVEKNAIAKYRSIKPRLVPATPKIRPRLF